MSDEDAPPPVGAAGAEAEEGAPAAAEEPQRNATPKELLPAKEHPGTSAGEGEGGHQLAEAEGVGPVEGEGGEDDVPLADIPRFMMPNIASILPEFTNSEQDYIRRTFANSNYDALAKLPDNIKLHEVHKMRHAYMEAAKSNLVPPLPEGGTSCPKGINKNGLFQEFDYMPSRYGLEDEVNSNIRIEREAKQMEAHAEGFRPAGSMRKLPFEEGFEPEAYYPYTPDPYEASMDQILRAKWLEDSKILAGPFVPSGGDRPVGKAPTKAMTREIIDKLQESILADWEAADMAIYANELEQWVIRISLESVDSEQGLVAYMNILVRCNPLVLKYNLTRVVEHWNIKPGDGFIYFTLCPPWVAMEHVETFYNLHPEERSYRTKFEEDEAEAARAGGGARGGGRMAIGR